MDTWLRHTDVRKGSSLYGTICFCHQELMGQVCVCGCGGVVKWVNRDFMTVQGHHGQLPALGEAPAHDGYLWAVK